ncbi:hypothetical protein ACIRS1_27375 [Kitasatospora sp. NPDC101176]|uniref:hypothetical protein n=1 Tax=Kitasatospora sp. NPDC101176 TaxID=3364099 RepID=UPI0038147E38
MSDEPTAHRLIDAYFTHCDTCQEHRQDCHSRDHWNLYLDLDVTTMQRLRHWAATPDPLHPLSLAERAILLGWLDARTVDDDQ